MHSVEQCETKNQINKVFLLLFVHKKKILACTYITAPTCHGTNSLLP